MPIRKYRDVSEMPPAYERPTDKPLDQRIRELWRWSRALGGYPGPIRGVRKFRSIEDSTRD